MSDTNAILELYMQAEMLGVALQTFCQHIYDIASRHDFQDYIAHMVWQCFSLFLGGLFQHAPSPPRISGT